MTKNVTAAYEAKEDWAKMIEVTTWMTPERAKELGLVDEIK